MTKEERGEWLLGVLDSDVSADAKIIAVVMYVYKKEQFTMDELIEFGKDNGFLDPEGFNDE